MQEMDYFIQTGFIFGNHIAAWALALVAFLAAFILANKVRKIIAARLVQTGDARSQQVIGILSALLRSTHRFFILAVALGLAKQLLILPHQFDRIVSGVVLVAVLVQVGVWASNLASMWIDSYLQDTRKRDPASTSAAQIIRISCLTIVWSAILLMGLSNFGIDITGLVAGLGVGGIAVAFALQSVLKDLFASLAIILDKPFVIGDFIVFDNQPGTVERIGLKTTRVRSLSGEQISVSNDALLATRLRNFKRMEERRIAFSIVCEYGAPIDKLEELPSYLKSVITGLERTRFDRAHLAELTDLGPRFEIVYFVLSPEYNVYMDVHQRILLSIARWFEDNGLQFAQPSRRILIDSQQLRKVTNETITDRAGMRAVLRSAGK